MKICLGFEHFYSHQVVAKELDSMMQTTKSIANNIGACGSSFLIGVNVAMLTEKHGADEVGSMFNKLKSLGDNVAALKKKTT